MRDAVDPARYAALFLADSRDNLRRAGSSLLEWERHPGATEPVDELFRALHSVKGAAATMGYGGVADLAHAGEHLLEAIRRRELPASKAVIGLMFRTVDVLEQGVEAAELGTEPADAIPLAEALRRMAGSGACGGAGGPVPVDPVGPGDRAGPAARTLTQSVRVAPERLDELLQHAGELVVARNRLDAHARGRRDATLESFSGHMGTLIRAMYSGVLRARLAPVTELFDRFPRVVRDLSASLGKRAALEILAEGIELDRGMLEALMDPLVHLIRNAIDHGIESPADRGAAGKPAEGRLVLRAERRREWVALHLTDDGRGIDAVQVATRAHALGLREDEEPPSADELLSLLARPGFTLKTEVTTVSGRGVGMDVVVTAVRGLGGRVEMRSRLGKGTTFSLVMPHTTAVQRVLLVQVSGERYAIPFRVIAEAAQPDGKTLTAACAQGGFSFRGRAVPFQDLGAVVGGPATNDRRRPVLVLEWGARQAVIAVDALLGQMDVLIERVEAPVGLPAWVSGATILADGSPAFVLDPTALF